MTITGTATQSTGPQQRQITFVLELVDPCDPPDLVQSSVLFDQVYTITDNNATPYTHLAFIVEPEYCNLVYSYTTTDLLDANGQPAEVLTYDASSLTFSFFYDLDLAPLD